MSSLPDPELILGFARAGEKIVMISPDGSVVNVLPDELYEEVVKRFGDGPQVIHGTAKATDEDLKKSYGVLYRAARKYAVSEVGDGVVSATENVLRSAHAKAKHTLRNAPAGASSKWKLRQRTRASRGNKVADG